MQGLSPIPRSPYQSEVCPLFSEEKPPLQKSLLLTLKMQISDNLKNLL